MANLGQGEVKNVKFEDIKVLDRTISIWTLNLRSSSDLLKVPRLDNDTNYNVSSLTESHTAAFYSSTKGESLVQITGGASGETAVVVAMHRQGLSNNLTLRRGTFN